MYVIRRKIISIIRACFKTFFPIIAAFYKEKSSLDEATARAILMETSPSPGTLAVAENNIVDPYVDLQIIVPAYNVERYIRDCMASILSQETEYTYQVVLIEDGATDATVQIVDEYEDDPRVNIIHQENKGFSGARNTGLKTLFGKYIMFVDSDDMLCPGTVQALLNTAFANDADVVEGGMYTFRKNTRCPVYSWCKTERCINPVDVLHGFPVGKVYRREIFQNICFPENFWFEDSIISFLVYPMVVNAYTSNHMVYQYRQNENGITATFKGKEKSIDTYWITEMLAEEYFQRSFPLNKNFYDRMIRQIRLNGQRMSRLQKEVQESAFVLSCGLIERYFQNKFLPETPIEKAIYERDFGAYRIFCKLF